MGCGHCAAIGLKNSNAMQCLGHYKDRYIRIRHDEFIVDTFLILHERIHLDLVSLE